MQYRLKEDIEISNHDYWTCGVLFAGWFLVAVFLFFIIYTLAVGK